MKKPEPRVAAGLLGLIPACHALAVVTGIVWTWSLGWPSVLAWITLSVYLAPPLAARLLVRWASPLRTRSELFSREFFVWWICLQFQALFILFPALEEVLRLLPEVYSGWLRLWGARVGKQVFWSARTIVLDRPFLSIGDRVTVGFHAFLSAHLVAPGADGNLEFTLAPVRVGPDSLLSANCALGPGSEVAEGSRLPLSLFLLPMHLWKDNRKHRLPEEQTPEFVSLPADEPRDPVARDQTP